MLAHSYRLALLLCGANRLWRVVGLVPVQISFISRSTAPAGTHTRSSALAGIPSDNPHHPCSCPGRVASNEPIGQTGDKHPEPRFLLVRGTLAHLVPSFEAPGPRCELSHDQRSEGWRAAVFFQLGVGAFVSDRRATKMLDVHSNTGSRL
jgi:hypothetical protein